jgi:hypothetical protein
LGAWSQLHAFDIQHHRDVVAPQLVELFRTGSVGATVEPLVRAGRERAISAESRFAEHYKTHARPSLAFDRFVRGTVDLSADCVRLDASFALVETRRGVLMGQVPHQRGGCDAVRCRARRSCPLYDDADAEEMMAIVQAAVRSSCRGEPVMLGRHGTLFDFVRWYAREVGEAAEAQEVFLAAADPLPDLLLELCRRCALWGWADGGHGEGLLGWLDGEETRVLAECLEVHDLASSEDGELGRGRQVMARVREAATAAGGGGLLLERC